MRQPSTSIHIPLWKRESSERSQSQTAPARNSLFPARSILGLPGSVLQIMQGRSFSEKWATLAFPTGDNAASLYEQLLASGMSLAPETGFRRMSLPCGRSAGSFTRVRAVLIVTRESTPLFTGHEIFPRLRWIWRGTRRARDHYAGWLLLVFNG